MFSQELVNDLKGKNLQGISGPPHSFPFVESLHAHVIDKLKEHGPASSGIHIGVAGFFNLDIMAARHSKAALLCDINCNQEAFWLQVLKEITHSPTRAMFVDNCSKWLQDFGSPPSRFDGKPMDINLGDRLREDLEKADSWLGSDTAYNHIRAMVQQGNIATFTIDLTDKKAVAALKSKLDDAHERVDSLYLSNIAYFLIQPRNYYNHPQTPQAITDFKHNVDELCDDKTMVIEASIRRGYSHKLENSPKNRIHESRWPHPQETEQTPVDFQTRIHFNVARADKVLDGCTRFIENATAAQPALKN